MSLMPILVLCMSVVLVEAEGPGTIKTGTRKKLRDEKNIADAFQLDGDGKPFRGNAESQVLLRTARADDAFDQSGSITAKFKGLLDTTQQHQLTALKRMHCMEPPRLKVFDLSQASLHRTLMVAKQLWSRLTQIERHWNTGMDAKIKALPLLTTSGLRFLPVACVTTRTAKSLEARSEKSHGALHPALLSLLSDPVAKQMAKFLPPALNSILCLELKMADTPDLMRITSYFSCKNVLTHSYYMKPKEDPVLAEALMQQEITKGKVQWAYAMDKYGTSVPKGTLKNAPADQVNKNAPKVLDKQTAPALLNKMNFKEMSGDTLKGLGEKACSAIPLSKMMEIPKKSMEDAEDAMKCASKKENRAMSRKLAQKMMPRRDEETCKKFLKDVDSKDEKCWEVLQKEDIAEYAFTPDDKDKMPCDIEATVRKKLELPNNPSEWTADQLKKYPWLLRCIGKVVPEDVKAIADKIMEGLEDVKLAPSVKRKVFVEAKKELTVTEFEKLKKMKDLMGAMAPGDVKEIPPDVAKKVVFELKDEVKKMLKPVRRKMIKKIAVADLGQKMCDLGELAGDVPAEKLKNIPDLEKKLMADNCKFRCHSKEQCAVLYEKMKPVLNPATKDKPVSREVVKRARDSGAICGITIEDVKKMDADDILMDMAAAFFKGNCKNPTVAQLFSDKVVLYKKFVAKKTFTTTDVELLGGNFFKKMDPEELDSNTKDLKDSVVMALGQVPMDDVNKEWLKSMAKAAVKQVAGETAPIDSTAVVSMGELMCGLDTMDTNRLTKDSMMDAAKTLGSCPDHDLTKKAALREQMKEKIPKLKNPAEADVSDVSVGGALLLTDCSYMDTLPSTTKVDVLPDMVEAAVKWGKKTKMRNMKRADPTLERHEAQKKVKEAMRCSLGKMLSARMKQVTGRKKRQASEQSICPTLQAMGDFASVMTSQQIKDLNKDDFETCADSLGDVTSWSQDQKSALAGKAKTSWQQPSQWGDRLMTAGTIAQGLTPSELSSTDMKLDYLSALGQKEGWTEPQEEAAFNKWLTSENSGKASSITGDQLSQLGHFVCGAKPEIIRSIPASAYKEAMSEIGDVSCSMAKRKEWANLAVKSLGPVTSWSSDQSAAVGSVMAGLSSSQMSKLSLNQLSQMELDTFKMIPPAEFNSLTVEQLKGLSSAHAQTVTEEQAKLLSPEKRKALIALGSTITAPAVSNDAAGSGAPGLSMTIPIVVFCTVVVILAITDI